MRFCAHLMHYWIALTLNTNAVSHIRGVGVNWALLRFIEIVRSADKRNFSGYQSCFKSTIRRRYFIRKQDKNVRYEHFVLFNIAGKHLTQYNHIYPTDLKEIIAAYQLKKVIKTSTLPPQLFCPNAAITIRRHRIQSRSS